MKPFVTLLVLLFFALSSNGQDTIVRKDTLRVKHPKIIAYQFNRDFTSLDSIPIDTVLQRFQIYYKPISERALNIFLGNLNLPYTSAIYTHRKPYSDFPFADAIEYNFHQPEEMMYYKTWSPFTEITYYNAGPKSKQEQKLNILHTQNVSKNVNVGFLGDLNYADGQYINQRTRTNAFTLWAGYKGPKYSIYGNVSINSYKAQENGGISEDTLYTSGDNEASTIAVNLNKANTHITRQSIFFIQRLYLTGSFKADSLKKSSRWDEAVSVIHKFKYERYKRSFTDDLSIDTAFYRRNDLNNVSRYFERIQGDSVLNKLLNKRNAKAYHNIDDSAYFRRFENTFQMAFNANELLKVPAELRFGIKSQIDMYKYGSKYDSTVVFRDDNSHKDTILTANGLQSTGDINTALVGSLSDRFSKTIRWGVSGEYYITGSKASNLDLNGDIQKSIKHNFILNLSGRIALTKPSYFIRNYSGSISNFSWSIGSSFPSQKTVTAHVGIYHLKYKFFVDAQLDNYLNYLYIGNDAKPTNASNVFVRSLSVNKLIDWGIFHTDFRLTFQNASNKSAVAIPDFTGFNSTYIAFTMFKVLHLQYGVDIFYNSPFYANTYMPLTGLFYSQDQIRIKNDPYGDMFLNIKIKRFRFFLKYERINTWIPNSEGFYMPHYPFNPSLLKYGLSWTFYD